MKKEPPKRGVLVDAVKSHDLDRVKELLAQGANPDDRDREGTPALLFATTDDQLAIATLLLDNNADVNASNIIGTTALMQATRDSVDVLRLLIDRGADLMREDKNGYTAMSWAENLSMDEACDILADAPNRQKQVVAERAARLTDAEKSRLSHETAAIRHRRLRQLAPPPKIRQLKP